MKKYIRPANKVFAFLSINCLIFILMGTILIVFKSSLFELILLFYGIGFPLGIIFFTVFLAERKSALLLDDEKIVLIVAFKKTTIYLNDIEKIDIVFHKGDKIISGDTYFYTFVLKSGQQICKTLFPYGKKAETEIINFLKEKDITCIYSE